MIHIGSNVSQAWPARLRHLDVSASPSSRASRAAALVATSVAAVAFSLSGASPVSAEPSPAVRCGEIAAMAAASAQLRALRAPEDGKLTFCHVASDADDCTHSEVLPAKRARAHLAEHTGDFSGPCEAADYVIVAVSGTLEEGFPLRPNLNYVSPTERVDAVYLGRALIRGLRAYLDIKDPDSREFKAPPMRNPVNPGLIASGDDNDANISSIYLVDRRQAARALLNEPRFLSMTPDLAKVDVHAEETEPTVRALILQAISETPGVSHDLEARALEHY